MTKKTYNYKALNRAVGKAQHQYNMISDGDRIAVGVSGGKDSLTMLSLLLDRQPRVPIKYELVAIYLDPGFENGFAEPLKAYCNKLNIALRVEYTDFGVLGHSRQNRENPCFLCSRLRRKRLFEIADEMGCKKLALGHHKDDIIETLFLNMFYAGTISTMVPYQSLFQGKFSIIRPLAFVDEDATQRFADDNNFPTFVNSCPTSKISKRKQIKDMLKGLYSSNKKIKGNIFNAMRHVNREYLF